MSGGQRSPTAAWRSGERQRSGIALGRAFGVEIVLDPSWFLVFVFVTWSLLRMLSFPVSSVGRLALASTVSVLFFASILAHELGHAVVANAIRVPVRRITLFLLGGIAHLADEPRRARDEFVIAAAGPAVSLTLAMLFGLPLLLGDAWLPPVLRHPSAWLTWANFGLAVFNLLPAFPLDGGRMLRATLWSAGTEKARATVVSGAVGRALALVLMGLGAWFAVTGGWTHGVWILLVGWFIYGAAALALRQGTLQAWLQGRTVASVMVTDCPRMLEQDDLELLAHDTLKRMARRCFPVVDPTSGALRGIVTPAGMRGVPRERWPLTPLREVMVPAEALPAARPAEPLTSAVERLWAAGVDRVPVIEGGRFLGMLIMEEIERAMARPGRPTRRPFEGRNQ